jgi:hypothetical protein
MVYHGYCPYWVQVAMNQNLTCARISNDSINLLSQVSDTSSCEPIVFFKSSIHQIILSKDKDVPFVFFFMFEIEMSS